MLVADRPVPSADVDPLDLLSTGRLRQVDVVRLLTFLAVISVHSLAFTQQPSDVAAAGAMMLLQFGREVFFTITAFVLVHSMGTRRLVARTFWPRRLAYVAIPYVVWTAIYYGYSIVGPQHAALSLGTFGTDLLYGGAMYHLYFLLVTLQLYLVFPALLWMVRRSAAHGGWVLGVVALTNLGWLGLLQYATAPTSGPLVWVWAHAYELLPTYSLYVFAGAYGAVHLRRVQTVVQRHPRRLVALSLACIAGSLTAYAVQLQWMAPRTANSVLQPAMLLSCFAAATLLYLLGCRWAAGHQTGRGFIDTLSDASFGVYLAHPLVLQLLLDHGFANNDQRLPSWLATVVALVVAVVGGAALSVAFRRTPLSLALTGRPRAASAPVLANSGSTLSKLLPPRRTTVTMRGDG
jgi:peptidoglycan/LPS O-acetylase OafA/YrhL